MLRSHGATSAAVDSLFAYHQKTNPEPSAPARPSPGSETSHYLPPQAAVQQVCRPGAPAQPRLQSWGSNFLVWSITAFLWKVWHSLLPHQTPTKELRKKLGGPSNFFGGGRVRTSPTTNGCAHDQGPDLQNSLRFIIRLSNVYHKIDLRHLRTLSQTILGY